MKNISMENGQRGKKNVQLKISFHACGSKTRALFFFIFYFSHFFFFQFTSFNIFSPYDFICSCFFFFTLLLFTVGMKTHCNFVLLISFSFLLFFFFFSFVRFYLESVRSFCFDGRLCRVHIFLLILFQCAIYLCVSYMRVNSFRLCTKTVPSRTQQRHQFWMRLLVCCQQQIYFTLDICYLSSKFFRRPLNRA